MNVEFNLAPTPRELTIETRCQRVQDYIRSFTLSPQSIAPTLMDVVYPKSLNQKIHRKLLPSDIEVMEDTAVAASYSLQANLMHRSISPVPNSLHHMMDSFTARPEKPSIPQANSPLLEEEEVILQRLGTLSGMPKIEIPHKDFIYFSDPKDIAIFAVSDTLVKGVVRDRQGRRVVYMEPHTEEWNETEKLVSRMNNYLPDGNKLTVYPLPNHTLSLFFPRMTDEKKGEAHFNKKEMMISKNIGSTLYVAKEYAVPRRDESGNIDISLALPNHIDVEDMPDRGKQNLIRELVTLDDKEVLDHDRRASIHSVFGAQDRDKTLHSLGFYSFLTNANIEASEKVAMWLTKQKRGEVHAVVRDGLSFFSELTKKEGYREISDALTDDLLQRDMTYPRIMKLMKKKYGDVRKVSINHLERELKQLPILETGLRLFMTHQIGVLSGEIGEAIKLRRNKLRSAGHEDKYREDGFPTLQNEAHLPIEINIQATHPQNQEMLFGLLTQTEKSTHELLNAWKTNSITELLIYCGTELWSQTADPENVLGVKGLSYTESRRERILHREYAIPRSRQGDFEDDHLLDSQSKTGMWLNITQLPSYETSDLFRMGYGDISIGTLAGNKREGNG